MSLIDELLAALPDGAVWDVRVGVFWTAVVVEVASHRRCGLASTACNDDHHQSGGPAVRDAGLFMDRSARELAELARSYRPIEAAIGMATINALLPAQEEQWVDLNAGDVIARHGADKQVALVGHFPFIPQLRHRVGALWVLALCRPKALVLVLGPSTPLSPILFDYGVHILSGSVVEDVDSVLWAVSQGANFRQVHRQGVRLVTMQKG
jgi:uncharacterized protein (DUF4213/DUF364 family)